MFIIIKTDITYKSKYNQSENCLYFDNYLERHREKLYIGFDGENYKISLSLENRSNTEFTQEMIRLFPELENKLEVPLDMDSCVLVLRTLRFTDSSILKIFDLINKNFYIEV